MLSTNIENIYINEIMRKDVFIIYEDQSIFEASVLMDNKSIGILPVVNRSEKLVGMLTDRDIVTRCCAIGKDIKNTKIKEIMSINPTSATTDMDCRTAMLLIGTGLRRMPIVEQGKVVGIISLADFAKIIDHQIQEGIIEKPCPILHGLVQKLKRTSHHQLIS